MNRKFIVLQIKNWQFLVTQQGRTIVHILCSKSKTEHTHTPNQTFKNPRDITGGFAPINQDFLNKKQENKLTAKALYKY